MLRCACGHVIAGWGVIVAPEVDHAYPHGDDERPDRRPAPLEATRRAHADQRSHEQAQVEGARVDEQSFEDVGVPAQMRPPHAPGGDPGLAARPHRAAASPRPRKAHRWPTARDPAAAAKHRHPAAQRRPHRHGWRQGPAVGLTSGGAGVGMASRKGPFGHVKKAPPC